MWKFTQLCKVAALCMEKSRIVQQPGTDLVLLLAIILPMTYVFNPRRRVSYMPSALSCDVYVLRKKLLPCSVSPSIYKKDTSLSKAQRLRRSRAGLCAPFTVWYLCVGRGGGLVVKIGIKAACREDGEKWSWGEGRENSFTWERGSSNQSGTFWHMRSSVHGALHQTPGRDVTMQGIGLCWVALCFFAFILLIDGGFAPLCLLGKTKQGA